MSQLLKETISEFYQKLITEYKEHGTWLNDTYDSDKQSEQGFYGGDLGIYYTLLTLKQFHDSSVELPDITYTPHEFYTHGLTHTFTEKFVLNRDIKSLIDDVYFDYSEFTFDVISGYAGSILWAIYFSKKENDPFYLEFAENCATALMQTYQYEEEGVSWEWPLRRVRNILGYSHGNTGIAHAFFELWNETGKPEYYNFADEAWKFEDQFFNPENNNWPDFRIEEDETNVQIDYMNTWCHGANGIGVANIRFYELTGEQRFLDRARSAYEIQAIDGGGNISLCHGIGGNIEFSLAMYRVLNDDVYYKDALFALENTIKTNKELPCFLNGVNKEHAKNSSLFLGEAGLIYACLRVLYPDQVQDVLYLLASGQPKHHTKPKSSLFKEKDLKELTDLHQTFIKYKASHKSYEDVRLTSPDNQFTSDMLIDLRNPKFKIYEDDEGDYIMYLKNNQFALKPLSPFPKLIFSIATEKGILSKEELLLELSKLLEDDIYSQVKETIDEQLSILYKNGFIEVLQEEVEAQ